MRKLPSATTSHASTAASPCRQRPLLMYLSPPLARPLFPFPALVQPPHRVLLRVRRGHSGVAARQEGVRHVGLEDGVYGPLDTVMPDERIALAASSSSSSSFRALLPPGPAEADARLAVLVLSEGRVGHGGWQKSKERDGSGREKRRLFELPRKEAIEKSG